MNHSYHVWKIPKKPRLIQWRAKDGSLRKKAIPRPPRTIQAPIPSLKQAQHNLLPWLETMKLHPAAHGFVKGKNVKSNATRHLGAKCLFTLDLKDFFPSVTKERVSSELLHRGISRERAEEVADLCTYRGVLPQGAPTSPVLANLVCREMDHALSKICASKEVIYTRYADDLTFSGERDTLDSLKPSIQSIINKEGFRINGTKTRTVGAYREMEITGAVINHGVDAPKKQRRNLYAILEEAEKQGLSSEKEFSEKFGSFDKHLGYASYMVHLNPRHKGLIDRLNRIRNGGKSACKERSSPSRT